MVCVAHWSHSPLLNQPITDPFTLSSLFVVAQRLCAAAANYHSWVLPCTTWRLILSWLWPIPQIVLASVDLGSLEASSPGTWWTGLAGGLKGCFPHSCMEFGVVRKKLSLSSKLTLVVSLPLSSSQLQAARVTLHRCSPSLCSVIVRGKHLCYLFR